MMNSISLQCFMRTPFMRLNRYAYVAKFRSLLKYIWMKTSRDGVARLSLTQMQYQGIVVHLQEIKISYSHNGCQILNEKEVKGYIFFIAQGSIYFLTLFSQTVLFFFQSDHFLEIIVQNVTFSKAFPYFY